MAETAARGRSPQRGIRADGEGGAGGHGASTREDTRSPSSGQEGFPNPSGKTSSVTGGGVAGDPASTAAGRLVGERLSRTRGRAGPVGSQCRCGLLSPAPAGFWRLPA